MMVNVRGIIPKIMAELYRLYIEIFYFTHIQLLHILASHSARASFVFLQLCSVWRSHCSREATIKKAPAVIREAFIELFNFNLDILWLGALRGATGTDYSDPLVKNNTCFKVGHDLNL